MNSLKPQQSFDFFSVKDVLVQYCHMLCLQRYIQNPIYRLQQTIILNPDAGASSVVGIVLSKIMVQGHDEMLFKLHLLGRVVERQHALSLERHYHALTGCEMDREQLTADAQHVVRHTIALNETVYASHFISMASSDVASEGSRALALRHLQRAFNLMETTDFISKESAIRHAVSALIRQQMHGDLMTDFQQARLHQP